MQLPLEAGSKWVLVGEKAAVLRAEADTHSMKIGELVLGSEVEIIELVRLRDGTKRALIDRGWLTAEKDGVVSLEPAELAQQHAAEAEVVVVETLKAAILAQAGRVVDLLRAWDEDESGAIDKREWRHAIKTLGLSTVSKYIDQIFDLFDADGSGAIGFDELNRMLRKKADVAADLQPGAAGLIETNAKVKGKAHSGADAKVGKKTALGHVEVGINAGDKLSVGEQIVEILNKHVRRLRVGYTRFSHVELLNKHVRRLRVG